MGVVHAEELMESKSVTRTFHELAAAEEQRLKRIGEESDQFVAIVFYGLGAVFVGYMVVSFVIDYIIKGP
jgi:hypothetical protein